MPEAIPVEILRATVKTVVKELLAGFCESEQENGIELSIKDELVAVTMSVIAPNGVNSIPRRSVTTSGEERTTSTTSEKITTDVEDTFTTTQTADGYVTIGTVTKTDPDQTTTRNSPAKTSETTVESEQDVTVTGEVQHAAQDHNSQSFGQNTTTRTTEFEYT